LQEAIAKAAVCHVHGIWLPHTLAATHVAVAQKTPIVASVHGMLEKWDLAHKWLRKKVYSLLFQQPCLARAGCLRALSQQEASDLRSYGLRNPIAIIPNAVTPVLREEPQALFEKYPVLASKRVVLFMGRIHRKKGILDLLEAWPSVVRKHSDAHLLIAGSDYDGTLAVALGMIEALNITTSVTFCGVLSGSLKAQALSASRVFSLPSHSEGMSIAVLEALSIGLPVVVTTACNIAGIEQWNAGFITTLETGVLAHSLSDALALSEHNWRAMSTSAQALAETEYSWTERGKAMRAVYDWLCGAPRPHFVID
jgi:poly(glycerol-phosphate) alpha-glucosyltransferase